MAVRTAPEPGTTVEKVTRTRVLTSTEDHTATPWRDMTLWDYLASLSADQWKDHVIYLYRYDDKNATWAVGKFTTALDEFKIQEMFGGGLFNVKLKKGPQLIKNEDVRIEGSPKAPSSTPPAMNGSPASSDPLTRLVEIMDRRMAALEVKLDSATGSGAAVEAVKQALSLNGQVFSAAMPAVTSTLQNIATPQPRTAEDELDREFKRAMIQKMLNPTDPIETFSKMLAAMAGVVKGSPLFGGGEGKISIATELVRQIPTVTQNLVQITQAWQMGQEAQARAAALHRGGAPINVTPVPAAAATAQAPSVIPISQPAAAAPDPAAPPPAPPVVEQVPQMSIEALEQLLCDIIRDEGLTVQQAAEEACALIERSMPGMTDKMVAQGEPWLLNLFSLRPVLQQVANHPRLPEFVKTFVQVVKAAPIIQAPNPNAPVA